MDQIEMAEILNATIDAPPVRDHEIGLREHLGKRRGAVIKRIRELPKTLFPGPC